MTIAYDISDVAPYVNWDYFFFAWGMHNKPEADKQALRQEAVQTLDQLQGHYRVHALFELFDAYADGDDIVVGTEHLPMLRQQEEGSECLCLADFIAPKGGLPASDLLPLTTKIGVFATSVDHGMETDFHRDDYRRMMVQLLADRLAEAAAERMHEEVRKTYWGYAPGEHLSMHELHIEKFQGIRPAVGYPSLPDTSLNFLLDRLIGMRQIGIRLTESGAMKPHASVSGLMLAHPAARYFVLGRIGQDQLADYARRRGLPLEVMRKFLAANL